jgi:hypothetical protein
MANYQKTQELFNGEPNRAPGLRFEKSAQSKKRKLCNMASL